MKSIFSFLVALLCLFTPLEVSAQLKDLDKRIESKVKRKIDRKADRAIDKTLNKGERKIDDGVNSSIKGGKEAKQNDSTQQTSDHVIKQNGNTALEVNRSSDFVRGEKVLFTENFKKDALNDFPAAWNTTGSGEIVELNNIPGKWLSIPQNTLSYPELVTSLPEHFTVEFDLIIPNKRPPIIFGFSATKNPVKDKVNTQKVFLFRIDVSQNIGSNNSFIGASNNKPFDVKAVIGKPVHFSMSVNKLRIRLYINNEKYFDLPKAFEPEALRNSFFFKAVDITPAKEPFYVGNLRIAESETDARSGIIKELMEKGNVSTNDIQFDFNSDKIKPSSFEILKTFGEALKQNSDLRIKIIGHTDNVGKLEYNKQLSAQRAEAVKNHIISTYGINAARIETEGMGATKPAVSNDSEEGRAKNRRVEFIKL